MCVSQEKCPVPFEQQPFNEYSSLKKSWFFAWSTLDDYEYLKKIFYIFCSFSILFIPFVFLIVSNYNFSKMIILDTFMANVVLVLIFLRLYLGWSYVIKRLVSATVFYEESGWYDGQVWIKNVEILTQDRLIGIYEVTPFIQRIKYSLVVSLFLIGVENVSYYLIK